jgi:hypothetical protein
MLQLYIVLPWRSQNLYGGTDCAETWHRFLKFYEYMLRTDHELHRPNALSRGHAVAQLV